MVEKGNQSVRMGEDISIMKGEYYKKKIWKYHCESHCHILLIHVNKSLQPKLS